MSISMNQVGQGTSGRVSIERGRITVKDQTLSVGAVVKVDAGKEQAATRAVRENLADDVVIRSTTGETYVASGVGFETLGLMKGNEVSLGAVKGRIVDIDLEEQVRPRSVVPGLGMGAVGVFQGAFIGLIPGFALAGPFGAAGLFGGVAVTAVAVAAIAGWLSYRESGWNKLDQVNLDLLKLLGTEVR